MGKKGTGTGRYFSVMFTSLVWRGPQMEIPICSVPPETEIWIQSPACVIQNFIHAEMLEEEKLGDDRVINLPGLTVSVQEMVNSLERFSNAGTAGLISFEPDEFIQSIVLTWPPHFDTQRGRCFFIQSHTHQSKLRHLPLSRVRFVRRRGKWCPAP